MHHPSKSKEMGGIPGAHRVHLSQLWLGPVPRSLPFLTQQRREAYQLIGKWVQRFHAASLRQGTQDQIQAAVLGLE